mgnify:CR=1 FL=1
MNNTYILQSSTNKDKKWMITLPSGKTVHFGARGYSDYTIHKDPERKKRYINRHKSRENWTKSGLNTAGFWSRWILWNLPGLRDSINDTKERFNINIVKKR